MKKKGNIVRYTIDELEAMRARGEDKTDWAYVNAMSQEEVERMADEDDGPLPKGWEKTVVKGLMGLPPDVVEKLRKKDIHIRLDAYVIDWFKQQGRRGYQTRINSVLRAFIAAQGKRGSSSRTSR
jgi:uncharacterized protein (DUF4415 family)